MLSTRQGTIQVVGVFAICCAVKLLQYSAGEDHNELKHAKNLNLNSKKNVFVVKSKKKALGEMCSHGWFYVLFLVYPSCSSAVFQTFMCDEMEDPLRTMAAEAPPLFRFPRRCCSEKFVFRNTYFRRFYRVPQRRRWGRR